MTPTAKLRFIERDVVVPHTHIPDVSEIKPMRILQQWWVPIYDDKTSAHYKGEWRDVPLERDE